MVVAPTRVAWLPRWGRGTPVQRIDDAGVRSDVVDGRGDCPSCGGAVTVIGERGVGSIGALPADTSEYGRCQAVECRAYLQRPAAGGPWTVSAFNLD